MLFKYFYHSFIEIYFYILIGKNVRNLFIGLLIVGLQAAEDGSVLKRSIKLVEQSESRTIFWDQPNFITAEHTKRDDDDFYKIDYEFIKPDKAREILQQFIPYSNDPEQYCKLDSDPFHCYEEGFHEEKIWTEGLKITFCDRKKGIAGFYVNNHLMIVRLNSSFKQIIDADPKQLFEQFERAYQQQ